MFLHFPGVIKHAAVTKFTAVTTAMCHESVTEPGAWRVTLSQPSHTIWHHRPIHLSPRGNIPQHFLTAALHSYSTLPGHEHVIITKPLQEKFRGPISRCVCITSPVLYCHNPPMLSPRPPPVTAETWPVINESSHKVKMRSFAAGKMLLIQQTAFMDSRNHSQW